MCALPPFPGNTLIEVNFQVSNIRDLLGHKVDLKFVEEQPAVRLDKN
jgi:hypothetical protein